MLFVLGIVGHGFMSGDMGAKMAMAASADMTAPDGGMDCDKHPSDKGQTNDKSALMACSAFCASVVAVLPDPIPVLVSASAPQAVVVTGSVSVNRDGPPDPYPPKTLSLIRGA